MLLKFERDILFRIWFLSNSGKTQYSFQNPKGFLFKVSLSRKTIFCLLLKTSTPLKENSDSFMTRP